MPRTGVERTTDDYFRSINGKTAALLATACRVGGIVAALPRPLIDTLTEFGRMYGMAFQVVDDILDVVASDAELGKPSGNDLVEGIYTLPVLTALGRPEGATLRNLLGQPLDPEGRESARALVRASGGVEHALGEVVGRLHGAGVHTLTVTPPSLDELFLDAYADDGQVES